MERKLSIVTTVYNEEESISELYDRVIENVEICLNENLISDFEMIFVDDGSTDSSLKEINKLIDKDSRMHLISLRKNYGKATGLQAAFRNVTGDIIITMDADLQDDPIEIKNFVNKIDEGYDLVSGWKIKRLDPLEKRLPSKLFNKVTSKMSGVELHDFNCGFKAYRREVVDAIDIYGEFHRYIPVLAHRKGFKIAEMPVHHNKRKFGKSKYGIERYLRGFFDSVSVSFILKYYDRPMYFFGRLGLASGIIGFILCLIAAIKGIVGAVSGVGILLILGVLLLLAGIGFFALGMLGDMIVDATYRQRYNESHIREIK